MLIKNSLLKTVLAAIIALSIAGNAFAQGLTPEKDNKKGLWGFVSSPGSWVIKPNFESVEPLGNESWIVTGKGKKGLLKNDGNYLLQQIYADIDTTTPGYLVVNMGGKAGLTRRDGSIIVAPKEFTAIKPLKDNYWKVTKGANTGLIDINTGSVVIKPNYDEITGVYLNGKAFILRKGDKCEILNQKGKRGYSFSNGEVIKITELPDKDAILLDFGKGRSFAYIPEINKAYPIKISIENFHGFTKTRGELVDGSYYTESDKDALASFLGVDKYYSSPSGETSYTTGSNINFDLFYMLNSLNLSNDLFKVGSLEPIGSIDLSKGLNKNSMVFRLKSGEYVDSKGNPIEFEVVRFEDKKVAIKNLKTGKYTLITDNFEKKGNTEYDNLSVKKIPNLSKNDYCYVVDNNNQTNILDSYGHPLFKSGEDTRLITQLDDNMSIVMYPSGNVGLKNGDKYIIKPEYDNIAMLKIYDQDSKKALPSNLFQVSKDGKMGLYDIKAGKMIIPIEKGYTSVGGKESTYMLRKRFYDSDLCYVQTGEDNGDKTVRGMWNMKLGKEVLAPAGDNEIEDLPTGYKGYMSKGIAYSPNGTKLSLPAAVDVYQAEWANGAPHFFMKLAGLKDRTVKFYITAYTQNGSIYLNRSGQKYIYEFSQTATPTSVIEYGPRATAYLGDYVQLYPFSSITLKFVLSAKDAKTGAPIPVKGEKSVSATFSRDW